MTRNYDGYRKGTAVMYQKTKKGGILIASGAEYGPRAWPADVVKFSGYYVGDIIDPVDNYVNVRKGPGRNHAVVKKVNTMAWCQDHDMCGYGYNGGRYYYQKVNGSNWWKLYDSNGNVGPGKFIGYI